MLVLLVARLGRRDHHNVFRLMISRKLFRTLLYSCVRFAVLCCS